MRPKWASYQTLKHFYFSLSAVIIRVSMSLSLFWDVTYRRFVVMSYVLGKTNTQNY
jgi:hypothetical protein